MRSIILLFIVLLTPGLTQAEVDYHHGNPREGDLSTVSRTGGSRNGRPVNDNSRNGSSEREKFHSGANRTNDSWKGSSGGNTNPKWGRADASRTGANRTGRNHNSGFGNNSSWSSGGHATWSSNHVSRNGWSRTSFVADGPFTIKVIVDGRPLNRRPQSQLNGIALAPGPHNIRVIAYGPRRTKELRDRFYVSRNSHQKLIVRSSGRGGPLFLDRVGGTRGRRGRRHDATAQYSANYCYDAQFFNVQQVVEQMRCRPFDQGKLEIAKSAVHHNILYADDLSFLMEQLTFDQAKVELAAFAYSRLCNAHELYLVFNTLQFQSSIGRLKHLTGYY